MKVIEKYNKNAFTEYINLVRMSTDKKQCVFDECKECIKEKTRQKRLNAKKR